jgi:hypothetical protein
VVELEDGFYPRGPGTATDFPGMMNRTERTIVSVIIALICPASLLFLFWWISAALSISGIWPLSEGWIGAAAICGLCFGVVLNILYLKRWVGRFYTINMKFLRVAYLFWSAIAVALLMGLPFLNIVLGTLAGLYVGRKQHHSESARDKFEKAAGKASFFTALVTGTEALFIGILALREDIVARVISSVMGLHQAVADGPIGLGFIMVTCVVLILVQYWCTRAAARFAFELSAPSPNTAVEES